MMILTHVFHLWGAIAYRMKYMEVIGLMTNKVCYQKSQKKKKKKNILLIKLIFKESGDALCTSIT